jgi:hypothetical protein
MYSGKAKRVQWYVVFSRANYSHWLYRFLDPCFQHVYAISVSPGGAYWVIVNPMNSHIDISHELCIDYLTPRDLAGESAVILPVEARISNDNNRSRGGLFTCVSVVKGLLGIDKPGIFTPFQLYRYLS